MRYPILLLALLALTLTACGSSRQTSDGDTVQRAMQREADGSNSVKVDAGKTGADLTSYLRRIPGVLVRGSGASATIRVRADVSTQGDTTPLFVVDGTPLGNNFSSVYNTIDINDIARVTVLKTVNETNRYGMQGASGVIEIKMKQ